MNVFIVCPYEEKYLRTCENLERINFCEISIIGDYEKINRIACDKRIKIKSRIIDIKSEECIVNYLKTKDKKTSIIVIGLINESYQKQIVNNTAKELPLNSFYVIDIPKLRHFIFVNTASNNRTYEMTEKRKGMISLHKFMKLLGIYKANVALITSDTKKMESIEYNLIKMILKENLNKQISFINPCKISDVFNLNSKYNIFESNINVLMFKNTDVAKTFIELLTLFTSYRIGIINEYNGNYYIDGCKIKDEENIIFTILLISKCINSREHILKLSNQ